MTAGTEETGSSFIAGLSRVTRKLCGALSGSLPPSWQWALARCIGSLWFDAIRFRRGLALDNLRLAFPEWTEQRRRETARASMHHFCLTAIETLALPKLDVSNFRETVLFDGEGHYAQALKHGRGVLFLTMHLGNGEKLMAAASLYGIPLHVIAKRIRNRFVHRFVFDQRESFGTRYIDSRGRETAREIMRACARNEAVAFVLDQFIYPPRGIETTFFGHRTYTAWGLALFALKTRAPVLPVYSYRDEQFRLRVVAEPVIELPDDAETTDRNALIRSLTQRYNDCIESIVRRHPEQWMWVHRRWKSFTPSETDRARRTVSKATEAQAETPSRQ